MDRQPLILLNEFLMKERDEKQEEIKQLKNTVFQLQNELGRYRSSAPDLDIGRRLDNANSEAHNTVHDRDGQILELKRQIKDLKDANSQADNTVNALRAQVEELNLRNDELNLQTDNLNRQVYDLKNAKSYADSTVTVLREQIRHDSTSVARTRQSAKAQADRMLKRLNEEIIRLENAVQSVTTQRDSANQQREQQNKAHQEVHKQLTGGKRKLEDEFAKLKKSFHETDEHCALLIRRKFAADMELAILRNGTGKRQRLE